MTLLRTPGEAESPCLDEINQNYTAVIVTGRRYPSTVTIEHTFEIGVGDRVDVPVAPSEPAVTWLTRTDKTTGIPSPLARVQRDRITVLACLSLARGLGSSESMALYEELTREATAVKGPRGRAGAIIFTGARSYVTRVAPCGQVFAVVDAELRDPRTLTFDDAPDGIGHCQGDVWTFDVISVALRPAQCSYDKAAGRVRRCVEVASRLISGGAAGADVRLFGPKFDPPVVVAEVRPRIAAPLEAARQLVGVPA